MICKFAYTKPNITNENIKGTNIAYIKPHIIKINNIAYIKPHIIKINNIDYLMFDEEGDIFINIFNEK